jgi:20S proteasome alpha/beta subunit
MQSDVVFLKLLVLEQSGTKSDLYFRYQGNVSAALVLGGVDLTGPSLWTVYPHGSTDSLPYVTMGSGSLAAMAVFEAGFKKGLEVDIRIVLLDNRRTEKGGN